MIRYTLLRVLCIQRTIMNQLRVFLSTVIVSSVLLSCSSSTKSTKEGTAAATSTVPASTAVVAAESEMQGTVTGPVYTIKVVQMHQELGKEVPEFMGEIEVELFPETAPKHCANFDSLVTIKFYDGTAFHRVIPDFMIQGGDPATKLKGRESWGKGMPGQTKVPAEFSKRTHARGILSAARKGNDINSATSQFFICVADRPDLDANYTVFGRVLSGMEVADKIVNVPRDERDNPLDKIEMTISKKRQ